MSRPGSGPHATVRSRRRSLVALVLAAGLAVTLAACGSADTGDTGEAIAGVDSPGATDDGATDTTAAATTDSEAPASTVEDYGGAGSGNGSPAATDDTTGGETAEGPVLGVGPDGLLLISGSSSLPLDFGSGRDEVATALEAVLGTSGESQEPSPECGNLPDEILVWPGQISLDVRDDQLISWHLDRGSPVTTVSGVGLGSTRAEVEESIVIEVSETSLGTEFTTNPDGPGMGGLLSGPAPTDTVTELWAGEICAFR